MKVVPKGSVGSLNAYAGYVNFATAKKESTYDDPLSKKINAPGAAEGQGGDEVRRRQTYEPVPLGIAAGVLAATLGGGGGGGGVAAFWHWARAGSSELRSQCAATKAVATSARSREKTERLRRRARSFSIRWARCV